MKGPWPTVLEYCQTRWSRTEAIDAMMLLGCKAKFGLACQREPCRVYHFFSGFNTSAETRLVGNKPCLSVVGAGHQRLSTAPYGRFDAAPRLGTGRWVAPPHTRSRRVNGPDRGDRGAPTGVSHGVSISRLHVIENLGL
eukprot:7389275-Prymnesium_polylepis.1